MQPIGIGIHCFAGGFTLGMRTVLPVVGQLEIHNFGGDTCKTAGIEFMNAPSWPEWDAYRDKLNSISFCYGNPRCTSFSSYSSGAGTDVRGPYAKPTQDIRDLCQFGIAHDLDLIAFESVQQCYTVGRPLLNDLRDNLFVPKGYRIAHVFVCTAAEGNPQKRRRYFFIAYRNTRQFNVYKPQLPEYATSVGDVLAQDRFAKAAVREYHLYGQKNVHYDANCFTTLTPDEKVMLPYLEQGWDFNQIGRYYGDNLININKTYYQRWHTRISDIPFSLHCPTRLCSDGHCPTIASTSGRLIHPTQERPLTVGEVAAMMGWPEEHIPVGANPIAQIGKGVVPATGAWLGEQIKAYFDGDWGTDDFESTYDCNRRAWVGGDANGKLEKTFNLTRYIPPLKEAARDAE